MQSKKNDAISEQTVNNSGNQVLRLMPVFHPNIFYINI